MCINQALCYHSRGWALSAHKFRFTASCSESRCGWSSLRVRPTYWALSNLMCLINANLGLLKHHMLDKSYPISPDRCPAEHQVSRMWKCSILFELNFITCGHKQLVTNWRKWNSIISGCNTFISVYWNLAEAPGRQSQVPCASFVCLSEMGGRW